MIITFYKIYCKDTNITDCYIGHTTNFGDRQRRHKSNCKTIKSKVYTIIRENGGWENWIMEELENTNCVDNEKSRIREQELIIEHNAKLNSFDAILNKEKLKQYRNNYSKNYREKNKELISLQKKNYYVKKKEEKNNQTLSSSPSSSTS